MQVRNGTNRKIFVITAVLFICLYIAQTYLLASNHDLIERNAEVASGNATLASEGTMYICEREKGVETEYAFLCHQAEQIAQNPVQPVAGEKGDRGQSCVEELGLEACRGDDAEPPTPEEVREHLEQITPGLMEPIVRTRLESLAPGLVAPVVTEWLEDNPPPAVTESDLESQFAAFCAVRDDCRGDDGRDGTDGTDGQDGESIRGPRGVGIANITCPEKNVMVITLTDGKTFRFAIPCHTLR
jgi:hypothetical protein